MEPLFKHLVGVDSSNGHVTRSVEATIVHLADFMAYPPFKTLAKAPAGA